MGGIYDGPYVGYRIATAAERDFALTDGIVAIDANVMLDLYRYRTQTCQDLLTILERFGDRLIVPDQALREFWRHRSKNQVSPKGATDAAISALRKSARSQSDALGVWAKQIGLSADELSALQAKVQNSSGDLIAEIEGLVEEEQSDGDPILDRLETILEGRVVEPLTESEYEGCLVEGIRRVDAEEPPGFLDADKSDGDNPEGAAGDYLVWYQATRYASRCQLPLVIVTRDEKEDWWWRQGSKFLGPRPELTAEFQQIAGQRLHLMRPIDLLERAPNVLDVEVSELSRVDLTQFNPNEELESNVKWSKENVASILERLDEQAPVQAAALRKASTVSAGRVSREEVYRLGDYDEGRVLRGFTRPFQRVTRELQDEGVLPARLAPIFVARYPNGVRAAYFVVPSEVPELIDQLTDPLRRATENSQVADEALVALREKLTGG